MTKLVRISNLFIEDRCAANADYSLIVKGYFVNDLVLIYSKRKYKVELTINNLFDVRWKETQFETLTRLRGQDPINSIAFTAGTAFFAVAHVSYFSTEADTLQAVIA